MWLCTCTCMYVQYIYTHCWISWDTSADVLLYLKRKRSAVVDNQSTHVHTVHVHYESVDLKTHVHMYTCIHNMYIVDWSYVLLQYMYMYIHVLVCPYSLHTCMTLESHLVAKLQHPVWGWSVEEMKGAVGTIWKAVGTTSNIAHAWNSFFFLNFIWGDVVSSVL